MNHSVGTLLFVTAVVGNAVVIASGLGSYLFILARRSVVASRQRWLLAVAHDSAFHHPDKIRTSLGEWLFLAMACALVLVGLPVALAALFQFVLPVLGRAWTQ